MHRTMVHRGWEKAWQQNQLTWKDKQNHHQVNAQLSDANDFSILGFLGLTPSFELCLPSPLSNDVWGLDTSAEAHWSNCHSVPEWRLSETAVCWEGLLCQLASLILGTGKHSMAQKLTCCYCVQNPYWLTREALCKNSNENDSFVHEFIKTRKTLFP